MIKPAVGRIVWYFANTTAEAQAAIVAHVHSDQLVNLTVCMPNGETVGRTSVPLVQDGDGQSPPIGHRCEWMPYQKGQAAKTEQLERQLAGTAG